MLGFLPSLEVGDQVAQINIKKCLTSAGVGSGSSFTLSPDSSYLIPLSSTSSSLSSFMIASVFNVGIMSNPNDFIGVVINHKTTFVIH